MENEHAVALHDQLLAMKPESAKHNADVCPFCVEKASQSTASGPPDVSEIESTEGGATPTMSGTEAQGISQETHEALVQQKVATAIAQSDQALATQTDRANSAEAQVKELETELASVKEENTKLSSDLDAAQVEVKSLTEERDQLKKDAADAASKQEVTEKAAERAKQVTNLKLFPEEYVTEKAEKWAALSDDDWAEQLESWGKLKPAGDGGTSTETTGGDQASAMTGGDGDHSATSTTDSAAESGDEKKVSPRRAALGLSAK